MSFSNVYEDATRAEAYSKLEFPGTYFLAYRNLPQIISEHVEGKDALDFRCGTGRSTRFLQQIGFNVSGVDISEEMLKKARGLDPKGDYRLIGEGDFNQFKQKAFDLVLSAFTFDNVPTMKRRLNYSKGLGTY
jgi:ubiquinone/menaquinone biosynthesis C-methylase UbiE